jgi:four helix bundle protein
MVMNEAQKPPHYDLEERTFEFARRVRTLVKEMRKTAVAIEDIRQLVRASGSVGANYIEANEALGKKDFLLHIKISKKEAKESRFFLRLLQLDEDAELDQERGKLVREATELMNIFGAIHRKSM